MRPKKKNVIALRVTVLRENSERHTNTDFKYQTSTRSQDEAIIYYFPKNILAILS